MAGRVASVGTGADPAWIGRRVLADLDGGGYAERVVTSVENLIPIPETLGSPEAMALLHDGSTALALFEAAGVRAGESVLVQPAAGGLGSLLVQLARAAGARVIGAAHGKAKLDLVAELGADEVVDYGRPGWAERVGGVDVAFDGVGGDLGRIAFEAVVRGGRFSGYGIAGGPPTTVSTEDARRREAVVRSMEQLATFAGGRAERAGRMLQDAAAGRIKPVIGGTYSLEQAAEAHRALEGRAVIGKALLLI